MNEEVLLKKIDDLTALFAKHDPNVCEAGKTIVVSADEKKIKRTVAINEDTLDRWKKFLTFFPRGYESLLITGAMTLLIDEYCKEDGIRITEGRKIRDMKELRDVLGEK